MFQTFLILNGFCTFSPPFIASNQKNTNIMSIKHYLLLIFSISAFLFSSCYKATLIPEGDSPFQGDDPDVIEGDTVFWKKLHETERKILNAHSTQEEIYFISDNAFFRYDKNLQLIEDRELSAQNSLYGRPVLSDEVFVRLSLNASNRQELEFRLVKNPEAVFKITPESLAEAGSGEFIEAEFLGRFLGAFSADGNLFAFPAISKPNNSYIFFLFEIKLNETRTEFSSVELQKRIDPDLLYEFGSFGSIRQIKDNFYVSTRKGSLRFTPEGETVKIFDQWMMDFFYWNDRIYATGFGDEDLHFSLNNGINWTKVSNASELKMVEVQGEKVFTQSLGGRKYHLADASLLQAMSLRYNEDFPDDPDAYYIIRFFEENYFISVQRFIYYTDKLILE